jgi:formylglycine-generating enzyme
VVRAAIVLVLCGCQSVAGIRDVTLATDASTQNDTATADTSTTSDSETSTETPLDRCASTRGPEMVEVAVSGGKSFCIDKNEVTNEEFAEYAKTPPSPTLPSRCDGVALQYPTGRGGLELPQVNVTWCDAYAFCLWAGKRLCRALDTAKPIGLDNSEWGYVCMQGTAKTDYPYGNTFEPAHCVSGKMGDLLPEPVATFGNCTGNTPPFTEVSDLSGNVSEWVDECEGTTCRALGGYYGDSDMQALKCVSINGATGKTNALDVKQIYSGLGFRCCKDPM